MRKPPLSDDIEAARQAPLEPAAACHPNWTRPIGADLVKELAELQHLSLDDLRLRWRNHWGRLAPAPLSRGLLLRVMAYRLQGEAFGDLDRKTVRILERLADKSASNRSSMSNLDQGLKPEASSVRTASDPLILKPGALLVREWQGRLERVTVVNDGFAWNGEIYTSLSAAAFAITGTKWNGNRFFGLRHQDRVRASKRAGDPNPRSSALARRKAANRPQASRGSSATSASVTTNAGGSVR